MFINGVLQLTAVVSNDPNNFGVDWCVAQPGHPCGSGGCPPGACGGVSRLHTQSGDPVTFLPPTVFEGNSQTVTIVAFATADHRQNVVASITVSGFAGSLRGTYVFQATGVRGVPGNSQAGGSVVERPYQIAGVITLDGNGGVAAPGKQTNSDSAGFASANIIGGTYFLGPDGRGTLTINTDDSTIGVKGSETFSLSFLSGSQVFIAQVDGTASASGNMDLQTSANLPTGGYAFVVSGADGSNTPTALGGILNIDLPNGGISGNGTIADQHLLGTLKTCQGPGGLGGTAGISGSVSAPDTFGAVQVNLAACFSSSPLHFIGYVVDDKRIRLIETDRDPKSNKGFATAGLALGQGNATGKFGGSQSLAGNYVFGISGLNSRGSSPSITSAGILSGDGTGTLRGRTDEVVIKSVDSQPIVISDGLSANYSVDPGGTGRVDVPVTFNDPSNASTSTPELIFYLSGNGAPALVLDSDPTAPAVGVGIAFPQAPSPITFAGTFGFSWVNLSQASFGQSSTFATVDASGYMQVDPANNAVTGFVDFATALGQGATQTQLSGSILSPLPTAGAFIGNLTALDSGLGVNTVSVNYYLADTNHGFLIETDSLSPLLLGYFAARTPVCPGCP